jgi:hypothetical protein
MNILKAGWIVFLMLLIGAAGGGYYLYREQSLTMRKHIANKRQIERLEKEQKQEVEWKLEEKRDIETLKKLAKKHDKWWFLHDIEEELGGEFRPLFRSIGQMKVEEGQDYLHVSRKVEVEATYPELIRLLENLERERGFSIEGLKISASSNDAERHNAKFTLSCVEVKKGFLDELLDIEEKKETVSPPTESLVLSPPWDKEQMLVLKTQTIDPFIKLDRERLRGGPEAPAILPPIDLSSKYRLEGIISFPQYRLAIIGPDYLLKEGDWLDNMQVIKIDDQRVSLKEGEQEYFLAIPGFAAAENEAGVIKIEGIPQESPEQQPEYVPDE